MNGGKNTIRSSDEISDLFRIARRKTSTNLLVLVAQHQEGRDLLGRVAFIAGKRLGTAPVRSRAKRVMREAARIVGLPREGTDIVLVARGGTGAQHPGELAQELEKSLKRLDG